MLVFIFMNFFVVLLKVGAQCGIPWCGSARATSASYYPTFEQLPIVQKYQVQYTPVPPASQHAMNFPYLVPPSQVSIQTSTTPILPSIDSESTMSTRKTSNYEDFEKELEQLHPIVSASTEKKTSRKNDGIALNNNGTTTYVREYQTATFLPRPLPYRPVPVVPYHTGCNNQYLIDRGAYPANQNILPQPPAYVTAEPVTFRPQLVSTFPPPINDCCGKCGAPCNFRYKKNIIALASRILSSQFIPRRDKDEDDEPKDPKCNSEKLKDLMNKYITRTVALSKRLIQKYAESELKGFFSVFCSTEDFSYVARSDTFCQLQKNEILCYAFKHA